MVTTSFQFDEASISRIYNAYQYLNLDKVGYKQDDPNMDRPSPLSYKEIVDVIANNFMRNLLAQVLEAEQREAMSKLNLDYLKITGRS